MDDELQMVVEILLKDHLKDPPKMYKVISSNTALPSSTYLNGFQVLEIVQNKQKLYNI
jgi:hypothetical protein